MVEKKQILTVAIETFNRLGLKRVSVDDICFNLSISKKTFYHHYAEKEILINDFIISEFLIISEKYDLLRQESKSALELLMRYNQFLLDVVNTKNPAVLFDLQHFYPENLNEYRSQRHILLTHFQEILGDGIESGNFRRNINPAILAELRLSQLETHLLNKYPLSEEINLTQKQLAEHFIYGVLKNTPEISLLKMFG